MVPEIRFEGYTGEWEERAFGSLISETREKTSVEDEDTLLSCSINGIYLNSELFSHFRGQSNIGYIKVKKNDLILSAQNLHLGNCNVNLRFDHGIISPAYKVYELINCHPLFAQAWVKKDNAKNFFERASTEGASLCRKNIIWEELYKQELVIPGTNEQEKIGSCFSELNALITLHQRKLTNLQNLKASMLEKMFPKEGEKVPEIRFEGFIGTWEKCKLLDFVQLYNGLTYSPDNIVSSEGTLVLRSSNVKNDEVVDADNVYVKNDIVNCENVKIGDIIVVVRNGSRSLIGKHAQIKQDMPNTVIGAFMTGLRSEHPEFANALLSTPAFVAEVEKNMGATINQITNGMFAKMQFMIPTYSKEQDKIGEYFQDLDNLIGLHQRKLISLQNLKKAMLDKLFV